MPPCFMYGRPAPPHMELHYSSTRNLLNPSTSASAALEQLSYGARHGGEDQAGPEGGDPGEGRGVLLLPAQGGQGGGAQPRRRAADVRRPAPRVCPRTHRRGEAGAGLWQGGEEEEDAPWRPRRQGRQGRRGRRPRQGGGERGGAAAAPSDRDGEEEPAGPSEARPPVLGLRGPGHHGRGGHQGRAQGGGVRDQGARQAAQAGGEGAGRGRVPHRQARRPRRTRRTRAHPPRLQARAALAVRGRRRRRAAGGHERGAGGVVPRADQEPGAGRRRRQRRRVWRAAGEAQGGVPGAPAGAVREQPLRAGRPAGPAQLRGVRAAAHLGVGRRGGGAGPGAADRDGERNGNGDGARGPCRRGVLGPGEDVRRGGRREAAAHRELGLGTA